MSHNKIKVGGQSPNSSGEISVAINSLSDVSYSNGDLVITSLDTIKIPDASGTNAAGTAFNLSAGASTGTGNGGSINLRVTPAGTSGSSVNSHENALTINSAKTANFSGEVLLSANIALNGPGGHIGWKQDASTYPAISINSTGDITKIGQSTATSNYVLTWNGSAAVWSAPSGGGSRPDVTEITTASYTIADSSNLEDIFLCKTSASAVTLPTAIGNEGYKIQIKNLLTSAITVSAPNPGTQQTIDGSNSISITSQYESLTFVSDNANWFII